MGPLSPSTQVAKVIEEQRVQEIGKPNPQGSPAVRQPQLEVMVRPQGMDIGASSSSQKFDAKAWKEDLWMTFQEGLQLQSKPSSYNLKKLSQNS